MSNRKRPANSNQRKQTVGMQRQAQATQMQKWMEQGIKIIEALHEPPQIAGHNEVLVRIRAAAVLPFYKRFSTETAVQIVSMAINAAYWIGKGARLSEEVLTQNDNEQRQTD